MFPYIVVTVVVVHTHTLFNTRSIRHSFKPRNCYLPILNSNMLSATTLAVLAAFAGTVFAHPTPEPSDLGLPSRNSSMCIHDNLYNIFHDATNFPKAESFCSSYLGVHTLTTTRTVLGRPSTAFYGTTRTLTPATIYATVTNYAEVTSTITKTTYTTIVVDTTTTVATDTNTIRETTTLSTTDATSFSTETSSATFTTTDATVSFVQTELETATATATVTAAAVKKRSAKCGGKKPGWLSSASKSHSPSSLSSACSCLITPTMETVTVTATSRPLTRSGFPQFVSSAAAIASHTANVTYTRTASTLVTGTIAPTAVRNATATTSVTRTIIQTVDLTALATTTITRTRTIEDTATVSSFVRVSRRSCPTSPEPSYVLTTWQSTTTTTTTTTTAPAATPTGCTGLASPYISMDGKQFDLHCDTVYTNANILTAVLDLTLQQCIEQCSGRTGCVGVDFYEGGGGTCYLFSGFTRGGQSNSSFAAAILQGS
ncbi:hypothetical protein GGR56DRAFT_169597 [Xylariaceae sp. FL0804]|nr:hypothetical protein GGR56DRAFT_169597 [Xylariaceae sp. FL0804]